MVFGLGGCEHASSFVGAVDELVFEAWTNRHTVMVDRQALGSPTARNNSSRLLRREGDPSGRQIPGRGDHGTLQPPVAHRAVVKSRFMATSANATESGRFLRDFGSHDPVPFQAPRV